MIFLIELFKKNKLTAEFIKTYLSDFDLHNVVSKEVNFGYKLDKTFLMNYRSEIDWFRISIDEPLDEQDVIEFQEELLNEKHYPNGTTVLFSINKKIKWTSSLIERFSNDISWYEISKNPSIPWDSYLLYKYSKFLYHTQIIENFNGIWTIDMIETIIDPKERKEYCLEKLAKCKNISWPLSLINKYGIGSWVSDIIKNNTLEMDFQILEINIKEMDSKLFNYIMRSPKLIWDIEKIELYYELIDFDTLSLCSNVAWTKELFEMFMDRWDFKLLSQNKHFCWDSNFIWEHIDKWDFIALSNLSTFPWSLDLISSFIDKLDITALFWNINIQFTGDYIEKHKNSINWKGEINYGGKVKYRYIAAEISRARNVEINVNTLKEKAVLWESGDHVYVRNSEAIPEPSDWHYYSSNHYITEDHLEIFKEKLSWEIVSNNKYIKLNIQMLKKFSKYWDWKIISAREDIPWTDEYLLELNNFLNWDIFLKNKNMVDKIFLPHRNLINNYLLHMKK